MGDHFSATGPSQGLGSRLIRTLGREDAFALMNRSTAALTQVTNTASATKARDYKEASCVYDCFGTTLSQRVEEDLAQGRPCLYLDDLLTLSVISDYPFQTIFSDASQTILTQRTSSQRRDENDSLRRIEQAKLSNDAEMLSAAQTSLASATQPNPHYRAITSTMLRHATKFAALYKPESLQNYCRLLFEDIDGLGPLIEPEQVKELLAAGLARNHNALKPILQRYANQLKQSLLDNGQPITARKNATAEEKTHAAQEDTSRLARVDYFSSALQTLETIPGYIPPKTCRESHPNYRGGRSGNMPASPGLN